MFSNLNLALSKGFALKDKVTLTRTDAEIVYHAKDKKPYAVKEHKLDRRGNVVSTRRGSYTTLYSALRSVI